MTTVPAPSSHEPERHGAVAGKPWPRQQQAGRAEQQGVAVLKAARYAGAQVIWALAGLIVCGGAVYVLVTKGPPSIAVAGADGWTQNDQIRYEQSNNERIGKLERILERMDVLLTAQAQTTNRILTIVEKQDERIKALEFWRDGERKPK